jgi:cobalamin biosynthesis protein CobT
LVRIGQDGKIFTSPNVESHKLGQTDVVLLIDASGSMGTIISKVVSTSFDLFNALRKCGINVDAYAHTATARDSKVPVLYHVCSGGVKGHSSNVRERFEKLLTVCYSQNYDSIILNELPKIAFDAKKSSRKIVFVLSDGVPAGDRGYGGPEAQRETRNAACRMRMMGIDVIAISLVPGVVKANDEIYGANFNIDASKDLRASFTKVITQLQKEGRF